MYYRHNLDYQYPDQSDHHMIKVRKLRSLNFDEDYPYLPKTFKYKFMRAVYWLGSNLIVFPLLNITHGLRIYGKKNLKKHKKVLKSGVISISNHVFMWDYLCVMKALRPRMAFFPAWKTNLEGSNGTFIRMAGGIPIPDDNMHAMIKFNRTIEEILESGKWLHFFPEGSLWFFYPDIRPLKKAVFSYAVKFNRPILPITISFRPRKGIMKLFGKTPRADLHIGEPLFHDSALPRREAIKELQERAYHVMQVMNGINPGDPTYNTDQNIANYKKTM